MRKTRYLEFKKHLTATRKTYFTLYDLEKFYPSSVASLKTLISRWVKQGLITRILRGYYTFDIAAFDYLQFGCTVVRPSYISFEYALFHHHLIDQVPQTITLATSSRHKLMPMKPYPLEYTHLKGSLLFGYMRYQTYYIAEPEKALLDTVYLIARGKRLVSLDTLDTKQLNTKKLKKYATKFPPYIESHIHKILEA